jgi:hypothetical protein
MILLFHEGFRFAQSSVVQWVSLILWSSAAIGGWLGATRGMAKHLVPRVVLAIGCTGMASSFVVSLLGGTDWFETSLNMRRGWGWIVAIGITWAAYTGIQAGKEIERQKTQEAQAAARALVEMIQRDISEERDQVS